jgi:hypothetical protein
MLVDPSRREDIGRCQSWRRLVAKKPLYWVVEKVCYLGGGTIEVPVAAAPSTPDAPPSALTSGSGAVSSLLHQVLEGDVVNSLTSEDIAGSKHWENASDGVQAPYIGTFFTIGSSLSSTTSGSQKSALSHGGSGGGGLPHGMVERPELFMCLLFRALMLSDHIPSKVILNMISQPSSKYLRVFGLFLGRYLFADRGQPEYLKRAWEICQEDSRSIRVLRTKGGRSQIGIETVDAVAFELVTSKQWEGNLTFPWCKPLPTQA